MNPTKIAAIIMLVSLMLQIGLQVDRPNLIAALRNGGLLGRAFLANFVLVPIAAVVLVRLLRVDDTIAVGILLMAIAPGVPLLPFSAGRSRGGSLGFALCLAFLMPALSIVTVPLTAALVLPPGTQAYVPVGSTILRLVFVQLLPLVIGMAIAERAPAIAMKLNRPLLLVFGLSAAALLGVLAPAIGQAVASVYGTRGLLTALLLVILSIAIGWLLGGPEVSYRRTLSIATALRNVGVAAVIATTEFPGTAVAATVLCYFIIQIVVSALAGKAFTRSDQAPKRPAEAGTH
jgi:BASS family bile acid:Na+ symporter